jgi:hypothetical protein
MSQSVRAILDRLEPVKDSIALRPLTENELNALEKQKRWCVQFSFKTPRAEPIFEILRKFEPTTFGAWSEEEVMPSGVHVSEAPFTFGVRKLILTKSDSRHPLAHPNFSFSFDELATLLPSESLIRRLDIAFHDSNLEYKLVDYGLLVLKNAVDEANVEHGENSKVRGEKLKSRKRRWWKFWWRIKPQLKARRWQRSLD